MNENMSKLGDFVEDQEPEDYKALYYELLRDQSENELINIKEKRALMNELFDVKVRNIELCIKNVELIDQIDKLTQR